MARNFNWTFICLHNCQFRSIAKHTLSQIFLLTLRSLPFCYFTVLRVARRCVCVKNKKYNSFWIHTRHRCAIHSIPPLSATSTNLILLLSSTETETRVDMTKGKKMLKLPPPCALQWCCWPKKSAALTFTSKSHFLSSNQVNETLDDTISLIQIISPGHKKHFSICWLEFTTNVVVAAALEENIQIFCW